ncbi:MAG: hypothetical protein CBB68_11765 [Rhodospirillaceae bacterium TMED8]|nr:hypothetical protein [Magnetovibrio sp.]OUT49509.1 MAG: hypothetical protein CBB68_11765 [Rhodospirillaceae bacterium TMED8]
MMKLSLKIGTVIGATLLAGCQTPSPWEMKVTNSETILFDADKRSSQVSNFSSSEKSKETAEYFCGSYKNPISTTGSPPASMKAGTAYDYTARAREVEWWMKSLTKLGTTYAVMKDDNAGRSAVDFLVQWANASALLETPTFWAGFEPGTSGATRNALQVVSIATYAAITTYLNIKNHDAMTPENSKLVVDWIDRLFSKYTAGHYRWYANKPTHRRMWDNSRLKIDLTYMAYAIMKGDDEKFQFSIQGFLKYMDKVRPDGSHPDGSGRGSRAIWYTGLTLIITTSFLEILENQSYPAYDQYGDQYHKMVDFFLDAIDDPEVIYPYAKAMLVSKGRDYRVQDLSFLEIKHTNIAWVEAFVARFPNHPNTNRIKKIMGNTSSVYRDYLFGGNASCAFRDFEMTFDN